MSELTTLLDCGDFDPQFLFQIYKKYENLFDLEKFKMFIKEYIEKSSKFEEKTGIPKKYFTEKINLSIFTKKCYIGYSKVKDIFIYFDDNDNAIFLRNKKEVSKIKIEKQKGNWIIEELDKLTFDYKVKNKNQEIDPTLYLSDKFKIKKINSFFARFYLNSLYDIVVKFNDKYFLFFSIDNIDEYSFSNYINEKDLLKIKRMLKINKIQMSNYI
jgi:hypothetical protein